MTKAGRDRSLTPKARRTRERILEAALRLFAERGYEATTMREVAKEAGTSLGLAYRYFDTKEEFALALYLRLAEESREWTRRELPAGTVAERFEAAMLAKLEQIEPHRGPLAALLVRSLDPNSRLSALGEGTSEVREKMGEVFLEVVHGAKDAPGERQAGELASALYATHLALILYWFHDRTEGAKATRDLVRFTRDTIRLIRPTLRLPPVARTLSRLVGALENVEIGDSAMEPNGSEEK